MARFFIVSQYGEGLSLARRLRREGHAVDFYIDKPKARRLGTGLINKVSRPDPPKGSYVLITTTKLERYGRMFRARGLRVFGGNQAEEYELDRAKGQALARKCGLTVPESQSFNNFAKARKFLEGESGGWFMKPDDAPSYMTRNAKNTQSMLRWLDFAEASGEVKQFELQRTVQGTEVDIDMWLDGKKVVLPHDVDIEEKKFLVGELGPRTGCESNLIFGTEDRLVDETILPFADPLLDTGYCGLASVNVIITRDGTVHFLEFTLRWGYDAIQAWSELIPDRLGDQFVEFLDGGLDEWTMYPDRPFALSSHISIPPYPYETDEVEETKGYPVDPRILEEGSHPYDVMIQNGKTVMAGAVDGTVTVLVETGHDIPYLRHKLLERAMELDIPQAQYRPDLVPSAEKRLDALCELGLLAIRPRCFEPAIDFRDETESFESILGIGPRAEKSEGDDNLSPGEQVTLPGASGVGYIPDHAYPTTSGGSAVPGPGAAGAGATTSGSPATDGAAPAP